MQTVIRNFPDSTAGVVHQTGQALTDRTQGVTVHLHTRDGESVPCSAEIMSGPNDEHYADIGLVFDGTTLIDSDGTFELPQEIVTMLLEAGLRVAPEFLDEDPTIGGPKTEPPPAPEAPATEPGGPIRSDDSTAVDQLGAKIAAAEAQQTHYKAVNAALRKSARGGAVAQIAAMVKAGASAQEAAALLSPDYAGRIGYASYLLTNNNANIRRMKERQWEITKLQATPPATITGPLGTVAECPTENRVRITFLQKPDDNTRSLLKSNGFRWAPTQGVWSAYYNDYTIRFASRMVGNREVAA